MLTRGVVVGVFAVFLTACGGGSGGDSTGAEEVDIPEQVDAPNPTPVQDDDNPDVIPAGDDDIGTIPDIGDSPDSDGDPAEEPVDTPVENDPESVEPDVTDPPISDPIAGNDTPRVARWKAALADEPSADASNRDDLLATLFELSRYDFLFDVADEVYEVEQRLVSGDAAFEPLNLVISNYARTHLCSEGGRVLSTDASENGLRNTQYQFENCAFDNQVFNGLYNISESLRPSDSTARTQISANLAILNNSTLRVFLVGISQSVSTEPGNDSFSSTVGFSGYGEGNVASDSLTEDLGDDSLFTVFYNFQVHEYKDPAFSDSSDTGFSLTSTFGVEPRDGSPEWLFGDFTGQGFRGEMPGSVLLGQMTLDTNTRDDALLVLQADNGNPDSFDLIGFTDDDTAGSAVYGWEGDFQFGIPRLYSRDRALQAVEN